MNNNGRDSNSFAQYRTEIDGVGIHFIHVRSKHEEALPIILTHGWPGSIVEFRNKRGDAYGRVGFAG